MSTELKAMQIALAATYKALRKRASDEGWTLAEFTIPNIREQMKEPRKDRWIVICPKCHGPMNLVRATCPKDLHVWLCDNPKCPGVEVVEP